MSGAAAVRTAYRLNVNKTKLYRLAKQYYPEIGPMKAAAFRTRPYANVDAKGTVPLGTAP